MSTETISESIMDRIHTYHRQHMECGKNAEQEPGVTEKIRQNAHDLVERLDFYPIWHGHLTFRESKDIFIRVQMQDHKVTGASLCMLLEDGWDTEELDTTDREAIEWMVNGMGWNPTAGKLVSRKGEPEGE